MVRAYLLVEPYHSFTCSYIEKVHNSSASRRIGYIGARCRLCARPRPLGSTLAVCGEAAVAQRIAVQPILVARHGLHVDYKVLRQLGDGSVGGH